jgi:hypothetical protein
MFISRSQLNIFRLGLVAEAFWLEENDFVYERCDVMAIEIVASHPISRLRVARGFFGGRGRHLVAIG